MNKYLFLFFVFFGLSLFGTLKAETVLYCQSELATGIYLDGEKRKTGNFEKKRLTIKFNDDFSELKGIPYTNETLTCSVPYSHKSEVIICNVIDNPWDTFSYNKKKKRFIYVLISSGGYVYEGTDTDVMLAGTCENF